MQNFTCKISISLISLVLLLFACDDVTEENLEGVGVSLISPGNNFVSPSGSIHFIWAETEGAEQYRLQIAQPDFDNLALLELDTLLNSNEYAYQLNPGDYQWRVRAENNFSIGDYSARFISVDSALVLTGTDVILSSPLSDAYVSDELIEFSWLSVENADQYRFRVELSNGGLINELLTQSAGYNQTLNEGEYVWSVQALNSNSVSNSTTRMLTVDRTAPSAPMTIFPSSNFQMPADTAFQFTWTSGVDSNPIHDSIFIYNENTNPFSLIFSGEVGDNQLDFQSSNLGIGQFSWELVSYDDAGNKSAFSNLIFFDVNP